MHRDIKRKIIELTDANMTDEVEVLTSHLKINGLVQKCDGRCKFESDYLLPLTDVTVCRLNDYCTCDEDTCECNDYVCFKYDWLNISINEIVAFSVIKEE